MKKIRANTVCLILLALAIPSIVFTFFIDKKYRNILNDEQKDTAS